MSEVVNMKIGIVGAGKVGVTLGAYLTKRGITITGYYSRSFSSASEAANFTKTKAFENLEELVQGSDTLFLTTPDGEIKNTWDCIANYQLEEKIICHFSGSLSSDVFSEREATRMYSCSIHPMYAFSDKFTAFEQFHTACLTMEGDKKALDAMKALFGSFGHKILTIDAGNKMKYHAAAAFASNYMVGLFQAALDLLKECGFSEEDSRNLLTPLVENNVTAMLEHGTVNSLTGPIERNDVMTIEKHLEVLDGSETKEIYESIGRKLVQIAMKKNEDRDYTAIKKLLS